MLVSISPAGLTTKPDKEGGFDWSAYVDSFKVQDLTTEDLLDHICRGNSFAPVFNGRPSRAAYVSAQVLAVDMDTEDNRSTFRALTQHPVTLGYGAIVYPTLSHTPATPRHRVVFVLDEPITTAEGYEAAARTINHCYPGSDPAVCNAGRNFFGNGKLQRARQDVWYTGNVLPLQDLRVMARQFRAMTREVERPQNLAPVRRTTDEGIGLEEVMHRLAKVDPYALSYHDWVRLGSGIAHTFGDGAYMMFKAWSDKPGKKELSWSKWKSLTADHPTPVGIGTVIHLLREMAA